MRQHKNVRMSNNPHPVFRTACELADIQPTRRQERKFQEGRGLAFQNIAAAKRQLYGK